VGDTLGSWDKGIDYEAWMRRFIKDLNRTRSPNLVLAIIQLRNGLRLSEAVRAYKHFLKHRSLEFEIEVSKRRRSEKRLVVIPEFLLGWVDSCVEDLYKDDKQIYTRYRLYLRRKYGINTHSLRYSFITYLLREGVSPSIVAKITKHRRLDYILTYTQEKVAEEVLRSI